MNRKFLSVLPVVLVLCSSYTAEAQHSVARKWNEAMLQAIRKDFARPTVQARNVFHIAIAMYDAWAAYDDVAEPYLLGKTVGGCNCTISRGNWCTRRSCRQHTSNDILL